MVSQAGSVPSYFRRFRERAMLSLMPLMIYFLISSLSLPLLTQIQGELVVGSEDCVKARVSPLTSPGPRVVNYSSKSRGQDTGIAISALTLPN